MQKMMTYSEANSVLGSSLTPTNRCLSKAVAIANDANSDLLDSFANNRLVPANVIEKATHAEVLHFFCDENGNYLGGGTDYTVDIPEGLGAFVFYTRILVNGQTPDISWFDTKDWSHNASTTNIYPYPESETNDHFSYAGEMDSNGILRHVVIGKIDTGKIKSDFFNLAIRWSNSAKTVGIDINNDYNIRININPIEHPDYSLSKTMLFFRDLNLGYGESLTINGFNNFTVTKVKKDNKIVDFSHIGYETNTADWFSDFTVQGTKLIIHVNWELRYRHNYNVNVYDIYKISDGNKTLYLLVSDGYYYNSCIQPGQEGDHIYGFGGSGIDGRIDINKTDTPPDYQSDNNFFLIGKNGQCSIDPNYAASYLNLVKENGITSSTKARIVILIPTTQQIAYRSDWFDTEDRSDPLGAISKERLVHNVLKISDVVLHINDAMSQGAYIFLEAQNNLDTPPGTAHIYNIQQKS